MTDQKATGKDAAFEFLQKHEDVWKKWVSDDAATKIRQAYKPFNIAPMI